MQFCIFNLIHREVNLVSCLFILLQNGGVFTFGAGMYGQLGHNSTQCEKLPRMVFELMGSEVSMLACGRLVSRHFTYAVVSAVEKGVGLYLIVSVEKHSF